MQGGFGSIAAAMEAANKARDTRVAATAKAESNGNGAAEAAASSTESAEAPFVEAGEDATTSSQQQTGDQPDQNESSVEVGEAVDPTEAAIEKRIRAKFDRSVSEKDRRVKELEAQLSESMEHRRSHETLQRLLQAPNAADLIEQVKQANPAPQNGGGQAGPARSSLIQPRQIHEQFTGFIPEMQPLLEDALDLYIERKFMPLLEQTPVAQFVTRQMQSGFNQHVEKLRAAYPGFEEKYPLADVHRLSAASGIDYEQALIALSRGEVVKTRKVQAAETRIAAQPLTNGVSPKNGQVSSYEKQREMLAAGFNQTRGEMNGRSVRRPPKR